jgi:hypothetical protein
MATANKNQSAAGPSDTKPAGPAHMGLRVTARPESFRRGGHTFTGEAKTIPLSDLTEAQAVSIRDDKNLVVQVVEIEPTGEETPSEK